MSTLKVDNVTNTAGDTTVNSVEIEDSGWIYVGVGSGPSFVNGWSDYGSTTGSYGNSRFRKINGIVQMEGLVVPGTVGTTIFTLPVGYRPLGHIIVGACSSNVFGRLDVYSTGEVTANSGGGASWWSILCSFYAAQ